MRVACQSGLSECQNLTSTWFREWMDEPQHNRLVCWSRPQLAGTSLIRLSSPGSTRTSVWQCTAPPSQPAMQPSGNLLGRNYRKLR